MATVLIIGASRGIGLETLKQALAAGHSVRALARTAHGIPVNHIHLRKIDGDALDFATVRRALAGADVVIQSIGLYIGPELIFNPVRLFSEATRILVAAMKEAATRRLICVTGFGAGDSRGRGGLLYDTVSCRQGHTGADRSSKRARMDYRSPGHPHKWAKNSHLPRTD
jgi:putative NADH-flavin reductase